MTRRLVDKARRDQAGAGARRRQGAGKFRIVEKTQVGYAGSIERRDVADRTIGRVASAKLGPGQSRNRTGGKLAIRYDKIPHAAGVALGRDQNLVPPPKEKNWVRSPFCFRDRKSTRLNSSHSSISYAVFCLKKKTKL